MNLQGKHMWLVGASEGIGAELARLLAQAGAHVAVSARNAKKITVLVAGLAHGNHLALPMDVTNQQSIDQAWSELTTRWPGIDMMLYNAGTYEPMAAQQFDLDIAARIIDVNFSGCLRVLSHVLPYFIDAKKGHIALVGSVAGYRGLPSAIGYGASKAAMIHLAENLKADLAASSIQVQIINPGFVKTRLTDKNDFAMPCIITSEEAAQHILSGLQSQRFEIHFPKRFSVFLKLISLLPPAIYFWLLKKMKL